MTSAAQGSVWQLGADAARAGKPASANPYPRGLYLFVVWMNGWTFAAHMKDKEDEI